MRTFFHDIEPLYDRYGERLYRTSLRIQGDEGHAEEAMHDTLLRFARTRKVPESTPQVEAWLVRTCVRLSIDRLRKERRLRACTDELEKPRILREAEAAEADWNDFLNDPQAETSLKVERIRKGIAGRRLPPDPVAAPVRGVRLRRNRRSRRHRGFDGPLAIRAGENETVGKNRNAWMN